MWRATKVQYLDRNIYIYDLCNVSSILKSILFEDDTNICHSADSPQLLNNTISQELSKLHLLFK